MFEEAKYTSQTVYSVSLSNLTITLECKPNMHMALMEHAIGREFNFSSIFSSGLSGAIDYL